MRDTLLSKPLALGALLLALAASSFGASYLHLGRGALVVALAIAFAKAVLVILFFMEMARERASSVYALVAGFLLVAILLVLIVADVDTREAAPLFPAPRSACPPADDVR